MHHAVISVLTENRHFIAVNHLLYGLLCYRCLIITKNTTNSVFLLVTFYDLLSTNCIHSSQSDKYDFSFASEKTQFSYLQMKKQGLQPVSKPVLATNLTGYSARIPYAVIHGMVRQGKRYFTLTGTEVNVTRFSSLEGKSDMSNDWENILMLANSIVVAHHYTT